MCISFTDIKTSTMYEVIDSIEVQRTSRAGLWTSLDMHVEYVKDADKKYHHFAKYNSSRDKDEKESVKELIKNFEITFGLSVYSSKILKGFRKLKKKDDLREFSCNFLTVYNRLTGEVHNFSCFINISQESARNKVFQSGISEKLANLGKESGTLKSFEDNNCSVCLSNYKEILDEDLHILIPSCGHPLCCNCADNILLSTKKECPQCR